MKIKRILEEGEIVQQGDLFWDGGWHPSVDTVGQAYETRWFPICREVEVPDAPQGPVPAKHARQVEPAVNAPNRDSWVGTKCLTISSLNFAFALIGFNEIEGEVALSPDAHGFLYRQKEKMGAEAFNNWVRDTANAVGVLYPMNTKPTAMQSQDAAIVGLYELKQDDLPLTVKPYETDEGNEGFALYTAGGSRLCMESGSYGYDTAFLGDGAQEDAQKTADFFNNRCTLPNA